VNKSEVKVVRVRLLSLGQLAQFSMRSSFYA
jgi:hypothetical protein